MASNEHLNDLWLQSAEKCLKVQISNSHMPSEDAFYHKTCYDKFVYFKIKIPKENPLYNEEV